jgi:hypothetical protein
MMSIPIWMLNTGGKRGIAVGHHNLLPRWSHLAVPLFLLSACSLPQHYENIAHPSYGAAEYGADLAQCRNRSVITVVSTMGYDVQSGVGVDEVKVNACMANQGWQQAPPSVVGMARL